jgi:hypothetical protein
MKNLFSLKKDKLETKDTIQKAEKIQFLWTMTNADRDQNIPERTSELVSVSSPAPPFIHCLSRRKAKVSSATGLRIVCCTHALTIMYLTPIVP